MFTAEQLGGFVRTAIAIAATYAVAKGFGDDALWQIAGTSVTALVVGFWSYRSKKV